MKKYTLKIGLSLILLAGLNDMAIAQASGSAEAIGGTIGSSAFSSAPGDTTSSVAETLYLGPGNYQIDGIWEVYSKNIWISPDATITGNGKIIFFNPSVAGGAASPTLIDGNNNAAFVNVNLELRNAANMVLTDLPGPGAPWTDVAANANLTLGKDLNLAVANGDVLLGNYDLVTATAATLSNYQPDRFVVTNGTGHLVHNNYTGAFTYPIGIAEGDYTPASVNNTIGNTIHASVQDYATSLPVEYSFNGINRTWNIYADNAAGNSLIDLQHNTATNGTNYNDALTFVTQYSAAAPNTSGQTTLSTTAWQSNNQAAGSGSGSLTTGATIGTASERSLAYTTLATTATDPISFFTKSSNQAIPLPVTLTGFTGSTGNCAAILTWSVAESKQIRLFALQRSRQGAAFETIAQIMPKSNNSNYTYTDASLLPGEAWYRLQLIYADNKDNYSKTVALNVRCDEPQAINAYPNPVNSRLTVTGISADSKLQLLNATGQIVFEAIATGTVQELDLHTLPGGTYVLNILRDHRLVRSLKLTKDK